MYTVYSNVNEKSVALYSGHDLVLASRMYSWAVSKYGNAQLIRR